MVSFLLFIIGLAILIIGGELLVMGAVRVAERFNVPPLIIGIVLIGFATSLPEFFTGIEAIQNDAVGITLGNVAGSNVANILLVIGLTAFLIPFSCREEKKLTVTIIMTIVTLWFGILLWFDHFTRLTGAFMLICLGAYIGISLMLAINESKEVTVDVDRPDDEFDFPPPSRIFITVLTVSGLTLLWVGAELIVHHGIKIAQMLSIPESVIGLTALAVGTSLPEIATCIISARRGLSEIALGNVSGSNIFNILFVLGATALIHPFSVQSIGSSIENSSTTPLAITHTNITIPPSILLTHFDWMLISLAIFSVIAFWRQEFSRLSGAIMLGAYIFLYLGIVVGWFPSLLELIYG